MIPGMNVFKAVMGCIAPQPDVQYYATTGRVVNDIGQYVTSFGTAVAVACSVQAVNRQTYVQEGLDFQRNYYNVFIGLDVTDLQRGSAGDRFVWNGRILQCESETDWFVQDSWTEVLVVDVGPFQGMDGETMV